jgi:hypothetical protein
MSTDATGGPADRLRASDAEREQYAEIVRDAVGEGRLTLDEGDERLGAVYAAKFRDELPPLVTDLPRAQSDPADAGAKAGRARGPGSGRPGTERTGGARPDWSGPPPWGRRRRPGFGFVLLLVLSVLGIIALFTGHFFWPAIPLVFLGLFLLRGACFARYGYPGHRRW